MDPILERDQALEDKVSAYTPGLDTQRLYRAFTYADAEHKGSCARTAPPILPIPWRWRRSWPTWGWTRTR